MCWYEQLDEKVREYLPDMTMEREAPLSKHTSFRIGGPARRLAFPANREQLVILMGLAESCGVKPFLLGRGTNLLVDDRGLDTLVIKTAEHMTAVRQLDEVTLEADAGILLNHLAVYAQQHSLSGLEFAHGIPGTLGGAICMNAGAYGGEMRQVVTEVTALLPEGVRRFTAEEAAFGYRRSAFLDTEAVVLGARLRLTPDDPAAIRRRLYLTVLQWTAVLLGILYKTLARRSIPALSLTIYLVMGWTAIFFLPRLIRNASLPLLLLILLGGVLYTAGAIVYAKKGFRYHHLVWHLFIDLALLSHLAGIVFFIG